MNFHVEVRFTGICGLVPDKAFDQQPAKVCVVLPDAFFKDVSAPPEAADATALRRHRAMVHFPVRNIPGQEADKTGGTVVWYIEKQRLTFDATGAQALTVGNLAQVLDIEAIANGYSQVDPDHLKATVGQARAAQVVFDIGHLAQGTVPTQVWKVTPSVLSPRTVITRLTYEVVLTISNISSFKMLVSPREGGSPVEQELKAGAGETIPITIAHLCQDNPLRWETTNFSAVDDEDTKWYFKLLSPTDQLKLAAALDSNELPIPRPTSSGGQGVDCSPARMAPTTF